MLSGFFFDLRFFHTNHRMNSQQIKFWAQQQSALVCANFIADAYGLGAAEINLLTEKLDRKSQLGKPKKVLIRTLQLLKYPSMDVAQAFDTTPKYITLIWGKVRKDPELELVANRIYQKTMQTINRVKP